MQNGNPQNPYCAGIDGVMEAYYQSLKSVQLYGPTNFSPVVNHVARYDTDDLYQKYVLFYACLLLNKCDRCLCNLSLTCVKNTVYFNKLAACRVAVPLTREREAKKYGHKQRKYL